MRKFVEPTMRNLLRQRLVAGISATGLIGLTALVTVIQFVGGNSNCIQRVCRPSADDAICKGWLGRGCSFLV